MFMMSTTGQRDPTTYSLALSLGLSSVLQLVHDRHVAPLTSLVVCFLLVTIGQNSWHAFVLGMH